MNPGCSLEGYAHEERLIERMIHLLRPATNRKVAAGRGVAADQSRSGLETVAAQNRGRQWAEASQPMSRHNPRLK
jgi:hypothetical protein